MITFKREAKWEYRILCGQREPLYIVLIPRRTISNKFDTVIFSIEAMSKTIGKAFDNSVYKLISDYQNSVDEEQRYAVLNRFVGKAVHFSKVFVALNYVDYARFADKTKKTGDSIFFSDKDIENILKLSHCWKLFSILINTNDSISVEHIRNINEQFLALLRAEYLSSKIFKYINILSASAKKYSLLDDYEMDSAVLEAGEKTLFDGLITLAYDKNPIPYFGKIIGNYFEYGGKYRRESSIEFVDDLADSIIGTNQNQILDFKNQAQNLTLNKLYQTSLFYLMNGTEGQYKAGKVKNGSPKIVSKIKSTSPVWEFILIPFLSKLTAISVQKLRTMLPPEAAVISFYCGKKLNSIFRNKFKNLFRLVYLFPVNQPEIQYYRLKNIPRFIYASCRPPINDLFLTNGSRIKIARLIENFIGRIKSTPFRSIFTGYIFDNINTDEIEIELIDFITRNLTGGFKKELNEFEKAVLNDFEP